MLSSEIKMVYKSSSKPENSIIELKKRKNRYENEIIKVRN